MYQEKMRALKRYRHLKTLSTVVISFLLGCMLTVALTPIDKTCRVENEDREHNIMMNSKFKDPDLVILILSAPRNLDKRNAIRETWLKLVDTSSESVKFKIKHYFVIGVLHLKVDDILHMSTEQSLYNDILILPMYDSYENLTQKVVKSFEWLQDQYDYGLAFKYVLKCDDDSFVRTDRLIPELIEIESTYLKNRQLKSIQSQSEDTSSPFLRLNPQINQIDAEKSHILDLYWGYFNGNARVQKSGKWKEPNWISCDRYGPYALGGGYILSKNLVSYIAKNAAQLRLFHSEDVSVGFWLAPLTNILRIHDVRFDTEWVTRGCQNFYLITHNIQIVDMKIMYRNLIDKNTLCKNEVVTRNFYLYNWTAPPSLCCGYKIINKS